MNLLKIGKLIINVEEIAYINLEGEGRFPNEVVVTFSSGKDIHFLDQEAEFIRKYFTELSDIKELQ